MKALTLYQPWASLIAMGLKTIETRSWGTQYTGPLAIHAAKCQIPQGGMDLLKQGRLRERWERATGKKWHKTSHIWPLGAIVATCRLVYCRTIPEWPDLYVYDAELKNTVRIEVSLNGLLGDFTPGRYAWFLVDIHPLAEPIPAKGQQRLWNWNEQEARA